jgi:lipopolysaccharide export LptBFGC system permease protein LptF
VWCASGGAEAACRFHLTKKSNLIAVALALVVVVMVVSLLMSLLPSSFDRIQTKLNNHNSVAVKSYSVETGHTIAHDHVVTSPVIQQTLHAPVIGGN